MAATGLTGRIMRPDVEKIFAAFVENANSSGHHAKTARVEHESPVARRHSEPDDPIHLGTASGESPILLTHRKSRPPGAIAPAMVPSSEPSEPEPESTRPPGQRTQRIEAAKVVPRVSDVTVPKPPVRERSEDGQIPAGELDRMLADMAVLLRYAHQGEVSQRLEVLLQRYPNDLLLLRRVAEFHLETGSEELAMESLFKLASALFERQNVVGMRQALEQVLVLDPKNKRAFKLLGLLEQRTED